MNCHEWTLGSRGSSNGLGTALLARILRPDFRSTWLFEVIDASQRFFGRKEAGIEKEFAEIPIKKGGCKRPALLLLDMPYQFTGFVGKNRERRVRSSKPIDVFLGINTQILERSL